MLFPGSPLETVYQWGDSFNKWLKKGQSVPGCKIVSIGNLTTGGTGKTPATIYFSRLLQGEDYKTGILSRGYGGSKMKTGAVLSDGKKLLATAEEAGDEPWLLAVNLPGVPVAIGRDRYSSALRLAQDYQCNLFLLDDGFQHYALKRDVDIVLVDATNPFGNGRTIPHGNLREPVEALKRSDIVIMTKCNLAPAGEVEKLGERLRELSGHELIFRARHEPVSLVRLPVEIELEKKPPKPEKLDILKNQKVWALSGIGSHRSFEHTLQKLQPREIRNISFRDHHQYSARDIDSILRRLSASDFLVTTEKDWVRLQPFRQQLAAVKNFYFLKIEFQIMANEILLKEGLKAKILTGKIAR